MSNQEGIAVLKQEIEYLNKLRSVGRVMGCIPGGETSCFSIDDLLEALEMSIKALKVMEEIAKDV